MSQKVSGVMTYQRYARNIENKQEKERRTKYFHRELMDPKFIFF